MASKQKKRIIKMKAEDAASKKDEGVKAKIAKGERVGAHVPRGTVIPKQKWIGKDNKPVSKEQYIQERRKIGTTQPIAGTERVTTIPPVEREAPIENVEQAPPLGSLKGAVNVLEGKPVDVGGRTISTGLGDTNVLQGTAPITPAGAALAGPKMAVGILKGSGRLLNARTAKVVLGSLAGTSGIMTWLASDNLLSSMNIFTRDLRNAVTFGQINPQEALDKMDESQEFINVATKFINVNTMVNPLLWPFRKLIMTNVEAAQFVIDTNRELIVGAQQPEEETRSFK